MRTFVVIDIPHVPAHVYREALTMGMKDLAYREGITKPHYPVPATASNALLAVPYENIMPQVKVWLLEAQS
jgi:hypothetical protein